MATHAHTTFNVSADTDYPGRHAALDRETALLRQSGCIKVAGVRAKVRAMLAAEARLIERDPRYALLVTKHAQRPRIERIRYILEPIRQEVDSLRSCLIVDRSGWVTITPAAGEYADTFARAA